MGEAPCLENKIYRLINLDEDFEIISNRLKKFNPMKVLGIIHHEYRHSNILAWLMDPNENHGLRDIFLKKIIISTLLHEDNLEKNTEISLEDITKNSFEDIEIYREEKHADIVAISKANKILILIENKIYSKEHSDQLHRYKKVFKEEFEQYRQLHIYLTLYGDCPSDEKYTILTHSIILSTLESVLRVRKDFIPNKVYDFILYYTEAIKELLMDNDDLTKICRKIYQEYKNEIDYIYSVGNRIDVSIAVDEFRKKYPEINVYFNNERAIWFNTNEMQLGLMTETGWGNNYPSAFWFENYGNDKLKLVLEIGPFDNPEKRVAFLEKLEENGVKFRQAAKEAHRKFTRIFTKHKPIKDWDDKDAVLEAMVKLYNHNELKDIYPKLLIPAL